MRTRCTSRRRRDDDGKCAPRQGRGRAGGDRHHRFRGHGPFLDIDRQPAAQQARTIAALRQGEVVVTRGVARDDSASEIAIEGGLINHWRYQQAGDGVIVEIESLTLSRNLPPIIGALIRPIVNSTARESMTRTLASVRARFMQ